MDNEKPHETQAEMVTRLALEDLQRRRAKIAPQVDANIEEVLKICEQRLAEAGEPPESKTAGEHWDAEYNFWRKTITEEVERLRFNGGYEPITVELYPRAKRYGPAFMGKTQVGHVRFQVTGTWKRDSKGEKILRIEICKAP